jgi:hypothetical protein
MEIYPVRDMLLSSYLEFWTMEDDSESEEWLKKITPTSADQ